MISNKKQAKKDNQEKILNLINEIDKIVEDDFFEDILIEDEYFDILDNFSDRLLEIFKDGLNEDILNMILKLENKNIFKIHNGYRYI